MSNLMHILERLNNPQISRVEILQRDAFLHALHSAKLIDADALSISVGDGIFDYFALSNKVGIAGITATDIVPCPVKDKDVALLREMGKWSFLRVPADQDLPFDKNSFDVVWHQDVIEHVTRPFKFLSEQYRVLREAGVIIVGTPNLLRPANIIKAAMGRLYFPVVIGSNEEIGEYVHEQEFHERQLQLLMEEVGFVEVKIRYIYLGFNTFGVNLQDYPQSRFGKTFCHFLFATAKKPSSK